MKDLNYYKEKIKEKRKNTSHRSFIKEITSFSPIMFYRNCDIISRFPESDRIKIIDFKDFEKSRDDLTKKGFDYNFKDNFFLNFKKLFGSIDFPNVFHYGNVSNSDFSDVTLNSDNCYLSFIVIKDCQNIFYSFITRGNCENIFNSLYIENNSINVYFSKGIINGYKIFYSSYLKNCSDIWFSSNLTGCKECLFCDDLQNVSYYIKNKKYSKQEYLKKKKKILKQKSYFLEWRKNVNTEGNSYGNTNVTGNFIIDSENIFAGEYIFNTKNAKNVLFVGSPQGCENFLDSGPGGGGGGNDFYAVSGAGDGSSNLYCCSQVGSSSNIFYSYNMESCSYCLGCIGLVNKSYCIFNKQYSKQDWNTLSSQIFAQMEKDGTLGEFFPGKLNPFYFNDTMAGILGDFTKKEVEEKGYMWRDEEIKVDIPEGTKLIETNDLDKFEGFDANGNWKINPEILNKTVVDQKGNYYRIVKMEYDFLIKHGLPLPRLHWQERMKLNF